MEKKTDQFERIPVYSPSQEASKVVGGVNRLGDNYDFRISRMTWFSLIILLIAYPAMSLFQTGDMSAIFDSLNEGILLFLLVTTIVFQWTIFMVIYIATYREQTGLVGIGFKKIRGIDFAWAGAFFLGAATLMSGVAYGLGQIGLGIPGEVGLLIPKEMTGKLVWVAVSITAGVCEEAMFRGYLMTRLQLVFNINNSYLPIIISSIAFGACHAYQGWGGFIAISIYGALFGLLYLRTGSIWPGVIAHFFQDFMALFWPQ